jgi:hypothetical protein
MLSFGYCTNNHDCGTLWGEMPLKEYWQMNMNGNKKGAKKLQYDSLS